MAEGKARAKAKRDAEKAGGAKIAVPEAPLLQEHKEIPAVLMGSEAGRKEEAVKQSAEGAELRQESATGVPCPTCGTKVSSEAMKSRMEGLKRKAEMASQIADQTKLSISVLEAMPPPAPKPKLKDLTKEALMDLLDDFEETHDDTNVGTFASWIGTKFPGVPLSALTKVANWAINEKYP